MTCLHVYKSNKYQYILKTMTFSYTRSQVAYRDYFGKISTISNMFLVQMYSKWIQCGVFRKSNSICFNFFNFEIKIFFLCSCSVERSLTFCSIVYLSSHDIQHCIGFFFIFTFLMNSLQCSQFAELLPALCVIFLMLLLSFFFSCIRLQVISSM